MMTQIPHNALINCEECDTLIEPYRETLCCFLPLREVRTNLSSSSKSLCCE